MKIGNMGPQPVTSWYYRRMKMIEISDWDPLSHKTLIGESFRREGRISMICEKKSCSRSLDRLDCYSFGIGQNKAVAVLFREQWWCLLLTGRHFRDQSGHNDFPVIDEGYLGFFFIKAAVQSPSIWTTPVSNIYIHYELERRKLVSSGLVFLETVILPFYIFVGHGYLQHAVVICINTHDLHYHMKLIPDDI